MLCVAVLLPGGCTSPCKENCERINAAQCPGEPVVDCSRTCSDSEELADAAECREQLDAASECELTAPDPCTARDHCAEQLETYQTCFDEACADNPPLCGEGASAQGGFGLGGNLGG